MISRLLRILVLFGALLASPFHKTPPTPLTPQQKSSHSLAFVKDGEQVAGCTGTAVGPHAILTAEHCDADWEFKTVNIDRSTRDYHIVAIAGDGRDHIIMLVDGPAFVNIDRFVTSKAVVGEDVVFYGFGGRDYPAHKASGKVIASDDPSDVDAAQGFVEITTKAIPGDSGSAVYDAKGNIVALLTYHLKNGHAGGFELAFPAKAITEAQQFTGLPDIINDSDEE